MLKKPFIAAIHRRDKETDDDGSNFLDCFFMKLLDGISIRNLTS